MPNKTHKITEIHFNFYALPNTREGTYNDAITNSSAYRLNDTCIKIEDIGDRKYAVHFKNGSYTVVLNAFEVLYIPDESSVNIKEIKDRLS